VFKLKQLPTRLQYDLLRAKLWELPRLLVEMGLAPSMAEARRLIEQGGVRVDGERISQSHAEVELRVDQK